LLHIYFRSDPFRFPASIALSRTRQGKQLLLHLTDRLCPDRFAATASGLFKDQLSGILINIRINISEG
jgi:hypothetical protein